ncbi:Alpha,alpha-trehalose-phosphate synthase UDP-forming [Hondaea fermentalgiana]|uniref:Alpha,alpha-trehalose-phosphate synthase UDP-forming n=1 Tax=Hondaea fermentalgiana TaxID=2315210 RepID=A0A2R5GYQ4_9STRA|nr:Alpha,alpha-trehalose-phosphate synthase UDP-forming [Hondaea fermentalgiana]|eukprot:GBG33124.1 Alpha,alpha-trehalose-phosphate synthase UDP-forming [Hondaea fermentalgiana]
MPNLTRITFKVKADLDIGQNVRITGDSVNLGSFSPNRGVDLVTTPKEYPIWRTSRPVNLPRGLPLSYKYVIMSGGQFHGWEPIAAQARVIVPEGWEMTVTDEIGMYEEPDEAEYALDDHVEPVVARVSGLDGASEKIPESIGPIHAGAPTSGDQGKLAAGDDTADRFSDSNSQASGITPDLAFVDAKQLASSEQQSQDAHPMAQQEQTTSTSERPVAPSAFGRSGRKARGNIHPHVRFDLSSTSQKLSSSPDTLPSFGETLSADGQSATSVTSTTPAVTAGSPASRPENLPETSLVPPLPPPPALHAEDPAAAWPPPSTVSKTLATTTAKLPTSTPTVSSNVGLPHKYRMFLVSFNLPVNIYPNEHGEEGNKWTAEWNPDSISRKSEGSVAYDHEVMWVGAITPYVIRHEDPELVWRLNEADREEIRTKLHAFDCVPIFLSREDFVDHYVRSCLMRFRDIFHNVLNVNLSREDMRRLKRSAKGSSKTSASPRPYKRYASGSSTASDGSIADEVYSKRDRWVGFIRTSHIFADVIMELVLKDVSSRDLVWVHNFPLMLVPELLRERAAASGLSRKMQPKIVFFLHTPFPTSEIFRTVSVRNELLEGMLGADVVGFHTFDHARHFITSCKRFLGLQFHSQKGGRLVVDHMDRAVLVAISHVGVEKHLLDSAVLSRKGQEGAGTIRNAHRGKTVIVAMDEMTRLQGVPLKLLAFERLLLECPRYRGKVVLIQHGLLVLNETLMSMADRSRPGRQGTAKPEQDNEDGNAEEEEEEEEEIITNYGIERAVAEVKQLCERINRVYGPVVFYKEYAPHNWPSVEERAAIWASADIMVCTPVMEGLNLRPLEYTFCHRDPAGVVIMSEFSAASRVLNGAIRVNCYDIKEVSQAMDQALCMTTEERNARRDRDCSYISNRSSAEWTRNILQDVELGVQGQIEALTSIDKDILQGSEYHSVVAFENIVHEGFCHALNTTEILRSYKRCEKRLILLDYAGTLTPRELGNLAVKRDFLGVSKRKLSPRVSRILRRLCSDKRNVVFVISGNRTRVLRLAFSEVLDDPCSSLGLVAHSGMMIRWGGLSVEGRKSGGSVPAALQISATGDDDDDGDDEEENDGNSDADNDTQGDAEGEDADSQAAVPVSASAAVGSDGWEFILPGVDKDWDSWMKAADVPSILEDYTWRTGGSAWRQTAVSASWQFRQADPEWGGMQAVKLENELKEAIMAVNIPVVVGRKKHTVELLPKGVDKGEAVHHILDEIKAHLDFVPQFCFCVGDDTSDERMYTAVLDFLGSQSNNGAVEGGTFADAFTCTVGRKPTGAQYYVNDTDGVVDVLEVLASASGEEDRA